MQTLFEFTLPNGYLDEQGNLHRRGVMRRATALDEVEPLGDARVRANEAYLGIALLSRVLLSLGTISPVPPGVVERLFAADYLFLQEFYLQVNGGAPKQVFAERFSLIETECPACRARFTLDLGQLEDAPVG
ncbi:phage tail assembly protein [Calidithermus roseus]|uniref:Phage tail assembly protein n=1 Tax=Calidithermus roseus TaxID=1644118 RepID=A0A399EQN0_9DEIN|nr:phage tail assembly protein [Calidithermus roseus]RIH85800.1 hypothetical protein Mrose_02028 [Calidithermus roseus]